jgi:hypothetical protein
VGSAAEADVEWSLMSVEELEARVAALKRRRVTTPLVRVFSWFKELDDEQRYLAWERIGICCGKEPCDAVAWILVKEQLGIL